jgi:hypothetical protein
MKPIDQMTLAECLNELRARPRYNRLLADRIHDLTRWIPVSERMPTGADGLVRCWYKENSWEFTHWQRITPPEGK